MARQFLYGVNPVVAALTAKRRILEKLLVAPPLEEKKAVLDLAQGLVKVEHVSREKLERFAQNKPHQGLVLQASALPITQQISAKSPALPFNRLLLCLDHITDPQNYGAILRSALFLGVQTVFVSRKNACPITPAVAKVSSGAVEYMDIREVGDMPAFLQECKGLGYIILATGGPGETLENYKVKLGPGKTVLVLGAEGEGIRPTVFAQCDYSVCVPGGHATVDSLNVSCATSIVIYGLLH